MPPHAPESLVTGIVRAAIGALLIAGFLLTRPDALADLVRFAALVVFGDAS